MKESRLNKYIVAINLFWSSSMPFRLYLKGYQGNCKVCWKKSFRKLLTIAKEEPAAFNRFKEWEAKYEQFIPDSRKHNPNIKLPVRFFRDNLSVDDILNLAKKDFEPAVDDSKIYKQYKQTVLFGRELDLSNGCIESCEVF